MDKLNQNPEMLSGQIPILMQMVNQGACFVQLMVKRNIQLL